MKKIILVLLAMFVLDAGSMWGQSPVAVTATVTGANSAPYIYGTYTIQLVDSSGNPLQSVQVGSGTTTQTRFTGSLSSLGALTASLYANSVLYAPGTANPAGTRWSFIVCSAGPTAQTFLSTGPPVCYTSLVTITSAGSYSSQVSSGAPAAYYINFATGATYVTISSSGAVLLAPLATQWIQSFPLEVNLSGASTPTQPVNTVLGAVNSGADSRITAMAFGGVGRFSAAAAGGTVGSPAALLSGAELGGFNAYGYDGSVFAGPRGAFRIYANQNWSSGVNGTYADIAVTPNGAAAETQVIKFENDGGIDTPGATGGDKGPGTINAAGLYVNGVAVGSGGGSNLNVNGGSTLATAALTNNTGAGEIDFTNPSGATVNATVHNAAVTIAGTSVPLGGSTSSLPSPGAIGGITPGAITGTTVVANTSLVINGGTAQTGTQGTDTKLLTAGTVSGTAATLCTDANGGATTTGCPGTGSGTVSGQAANVVPLGTSPTSISNQSTLSQNASDSSILGGKAIDWASCSTYSSTGTDTIDLSVSNCHIATATGGNVTIALTNPHGAGPYSLALCNDGTARTWTLPGSLKQVSTPVIASTCVYTAGIIYDGTNYQGPGSNETASILRGTERAAPAATASGAGAAWWDSTAHLFGANDNASGTNSWTTPAGTSGDIVDYNGSGYPQDSATLLSSLAPKASPTFTGTVTLPAPTINTITGSTQCLHVNSSGVMSGTGSDCGSGGGGAPTFPVNPQTSTYQALAADFSSCKNITVASGTFTITLVASGSQPTNGQCIWVTNYGTGVVTIARSGQNINGGTTSLSVPAGSATAPTAAFIVSDGTNYFAVLVPSSGAGGGTVTSIATGNGIAGGTITTSGTLSLSRTVRTVTGTDSMSSTDCGEQINSTASSSFTETFTTSGIPTGCTIKYTNGAAASSGAAITFTLASGSTFTGLGKGNTQGASSASLYFLFPQNSLDFTYDGTNWNIAGPSMQTMAVFQGDDVLSAPAAAAVLSGYTGVNPTSVQAQGSNVAFATGGFTFPAYFFSTNTSVRISYRYAVTGTNTPTLLRTWKLGATAIATTTAATPGTVTNVPAGTEIVLEGTALPAANSGSNVIAASFPSRQDQMGDFPTAGWFATVTTTGTLALTHTANWSAATAGNWVNKYKVVYTWESF